MLKSMTGFGQAEKISKRFGVLLRFEISSVNRKQMDAKFSLVKELNSYEPVLRKRLQEEISRGCVLVRGELVFPENIASPAHIDHAFLNYLIQETKKITAENNVSQTFSVTDLLSVPGVLIPNEIPSQDETFDKFLLGVFEKALSKHTEMRKTEGKNLQKNLLKRIDSFRKDVEKIAVHSQAMPENQIAKLKEKLRQYGLEIDLNDERVLKELVIFADKLDISEELTRLNAHFDHFYELTQKEEPVGRSLDFLMQEMFREINTIGNKAASLEISPLVVSVKTGLEQVREQVQNIE